MVLSNALGASVRWLMAPKYDRLAAFSGLVRGYPNVAAGDLASFPEDVDCD